MPSITSAGIPLPQQIGALAVFVLMGERAKSVLGNWRNWATRHNVAVMAVLFFVLGLQLLGDGIGIAAS
ncbi:hypothetical protein ACWDZ8_01480 [Streptomyces sp. NPDC003233]